MEESVVFTFPYQTNRNHIKERSTVGHVVLRMPFLKIRDRLLKLKKTSKKFLSISLKLQTNTG